MRLRPDVVGTEDGLAKYPYIRESRRIRAEFTVLEQHVSTESRMKETGAKREEVKAAEFKDSVGIGSYRIDLHPSTGGDNSIDISSLPYQIPLGALLPQRVENLLPACKNLGVTHITNGCYRLHPVGMEHRRSGGRAGGVLCDEETHAARGAQTKRAVEELSEPCSPIKGCRWRGRSSRRGRHMKLTGKYAVVLVTAPDVKTARKLARAALAGPADCVRQPDSQDRVALLVAGKDRERGRGAAGVENHHRPPGRAGEVDCGQAPVRHAGVSRPAHQSREQALPGLGGPNPCERAG